MKRFFAALSIAVLSIASHAGVITEYQTASTFPAEQNDLGVVIISGSSNGGNGSGVNLQYTFDGNTSYAGFNFTGSQFNKLFIQVTAADSSTFEFNRIITDAQMFWGFSAEDSYISTVKFFTTSASSGNGNVNNDKITVSSVVGYVQPTIPDVEVPVPPTAVPEPTSVALLGLGLIGFAASRRKSAINKNV